MVRLALALCAALLAAPLAVRCTFNTSGVGLADGAPRFDQRVDRLADGAGVDGDAAPADAPPADRADRGADRQATDRARDDGGDQRTTGDLSADGPDAARDEGVADGPAPDRAPDQAADHQVLPDVAPSDQMPPDHPAPPVPVAVSESALGNALWGAFVECIESDGTPGTPSPVRIVDSATVAFFDGAVTLAGAQQATKNWVQGKPSVTVVFDPHACDNEGPEPGTASWSSAGLLVRGAELQQGALWLAPGSSTSDINLLNVNADGTWQADVFGTDDAQLGSLPQLVLPINAAKAKIIELGLK